MSVKTEDMCSMSTEDPTSSSSSNVLCDGDIMMNSHNVLCTGGTGYIGSHTVVKLIQLGFRVTILDNLSNSCDEIVRRLEKITCTKVNFVNLDLRDKDAVESFFCSNDFDAVIHFAGLKAVCESLKEPVQYYENNVVGSLNLLSAMRKSKCRTLVFSSSANVYEDADSTLVSEDSRLKPGNPYGRTKLMVELILKDTQEADNTFRICSLRYFNPIGAHESGLIGESPSDPTNLLPYIQQVAVGRKTELLVYGDDWDTPDGTGVRDYIHVVDLAEGHVAALKKLLRHKSSGCYLTYNLGTGKGTSVLELVKLFERACGKKIPYSYGARREGDLGSVVADCSKAAVELEWRSRLSIECACESAWKWQKMNPEGFLSFFRRKI